MTPAPGIDWEQFADTVCEVLESVRSNRRLYQAEAAKRGISLEQLTAAAVTAALRETLEGKARPSPG